MTKQPLQLLTHSSMSTAKACLRRYQFRYLVGLTRDRTQAPLRIGSALHMGLDLQAKGASLDESIIPIAKEYEQKPVWAEGDEWEVERETVMRLLAGYYWRWADDSIEVVASEQSFELPLINPATAKASRTWRVAGVIDKIVALPPNGRLAVMEHKTTSDSLDNDSDYWPRLRLDQQISMYVLAARRLGYDVTTVLYDVIRKPSIRPKQVTKDGAREIHFKTTYCGEALDKSQLSTGRETPAMFGARLLSDIGERPEHYFQRREIPRLESDLREFEFEVWQQGGILRECHNANAWPRNTNACIHPYRCEFFDLCANGGMMADGIPPGFIKIDNVHPELERAKENLQTVQG